MTEENKNPPSSTPPTESAGPACACAAGPMRWVWLIIIIAVVVFLVTRQQKTTDGTGIVWRNDYEQALAEARLQNKPVLMSFHASGCGWCQKMKNDTYTSADVITAAEPFVRIMIDTDKQSDVAQKYGIGPIPAFRLLSPNGEVVLSAEGYQPPDEFRAWLQKGLEKVKS